MIRPPFLFGSLGRGDTLFFPLYLLTNCLQLLAYHFIGGGLWTGLVAMLLEGVLSSFNVARIWGILKQRNEARRFNIFEILAETILIEGAPVTLAAHFLISGACMTPFPDGGLGGFAKTLINQSTGCGVAPGTGWELGVSFSRSPCLLIVDFNHAGARPGQGNDSIFFCGAGHAVLSLPHRER